MKLFKRNEGNVLQKLYNSNHIFWTSPLVLKPIFKSTAFIFSITMNSLEWNSLR